MATAGATLVLPPVLDAGLTSTVLTALLGSATALPAKSTTAAVATGIVSVGPLAVANAVGFTAVGPAAGSWAAAWMSSVAIANGGAVPAGSLYACVQSFAMGGAMLGCLPAVVTIGTAVGVGAVAVVSVRHYCHRTPTFFMA